ncbi:MAG: hypothetical protein AB8H79_10045 [Myxococcota bacterium]
MRSWTPAVVPMVLSLTVSSLALAADEPAEDATPTETSACAGDYTSDQLVLDVQAVELAIIDQAAPKALSSAKAIESHLPCASTRLPLGFLSRVYRGVAGGLYVGGDRASAEPWFQTAIELDESYRYGVEDLPGDHPVRAIYAAMLRVKQPDANRVATLTFVDGGDWYLDGRKLKGPAATPGRPHLLQRDYDGEIKSWVMSGAAFPKEVMTEVKGAAADDGKGRRKKDKSKFAVDVHDMGKGAIEIQRTRPPEQVPLIVGGTGLIVAGLALGVGSYVSKENFKTINDSEEKLAKSQRTTNRLALGAAAAIAVGAGTLSYGFIVSDGGGVGGGLRGRW